MAEQRDFLDEMVAERAAANPEFLGMLQQAQRSFGLIGRLITLRVEAGLTQAELAKHAELTQRELTEIEGGRTAPSKQALEALTGALGDQLGMARVRAELLTGGEDSKALDRPGTLD
jgi:DNA-binding XRE family transcriptional regulator